MGRGVMRIPAPKWYEIANRIEKMIPVPLHNPGLDAMSAAVGVLVSELEFRLTENEPGDAVEKAVLAERKRCAELAFKFGVDNEGYSYPPLTVDEWLKELEP